MSPAEPILPFSARRAFFDFSSAAVTAVAKHVRRDLNPGDELLSKLSALISHVLGASGLGAPGRAFKALAT